MNKYVYYTKNLSTYFGASLIPMLLGMVTNPWIAQNMTPEDYAITGYYTSFSSLIGPIIVFYLIHYYIKEYYKQTDYGRERLMAIIAKALIWFSGIVSLICFCALLIYLKYIKSSTELPVSPYLALIVFALPLTGLLNLKLAQYRMEKRARAYFVYSVSNGILSVTLALLMVVVFKWGAFGKLLAPFACNSAIFLLMVWKFRRSLVIRTSFAEFVPILRFCLPLAASAMLGYFTHGFATTYLEGVGDINGYGIYVVGYSIGNYLSVFQIAINNTFQPDIYESIIKHQKVRFLRVCALQIVLVGIIAFVFVMFAPFIISMLTAGRYIASTPYAQIIAWSTLTSAIYYIINNYTIATNHPRLYLYTTIIGSLCIILSMPPMVKYFSFAGGAWVIVFSYLVFAIINLSLFAIIPQKYK